MAFNLNDFDFNHSVLDALGRSVLTYANIINRASPGTQWMPSPNAHHFPLLLAINDRSPPEGILDNAFPNASLRVYEPVAGELWPQHAIANESPLINAIICARRSETLSSNTRRTEMQTNGVAS